MEKPYGNVVLVTGASSGIGKSCAEYLKDFGFHVYGTSRKNINNRIEGENGGFLQMVSLDVTNENSIKNAVDYIVKEEKTLNILINCAGYGIAASVEDTSPDDAYKQFDTNFFGALRMIRGVLPIMRSNKKGLIIIIGSVAGLIAVPYQSMYSASKYALEGMLESLRMETKQFGIQASIVEPGDTKTGFTSARIYTDESKQEDSPYHDRCFKAVHSMEVSEQSGVSPSDVVKVIVKIMQSKNPPIRKAVGFQYKLLVGLRKLIPQKLGEKVISKLY